MGYILHGLEPGHSISYKTTYAPSEDSDQPAILCPRNEIKLRVHALCSGPHLFVDIFYSWQWISKPVMKAQRRLCELPSWDSATTPISILHKSITGRYRPVRVADGPIMVRCRFIKNARWDVGWSWFSFLTWHKDRFLVLGIYETILVKIRIGRNI